MQIKWKYFFIFLAIVHSITASLGVLLVGLPPISFIAILGFGVLNALIAIALKD